MPDIRGLCPSAYWRLCHFLNVQMDGLKTNDSVIKGATLLLPWSR